MSKQVSEASLSKQTLALMWGATGEQEWTPALTTGMSIIVCKILLCINTYQDEYLVLNVSWKL